MRRLVLPLVLVSLAVAAPQAQHPVAVVDAWMEAVSTHRPGRVDPPLVAIATARPETFATLVGELRRTLERSVANPEARNDVRRRGALLHTDIALLLPARAATFEPPTGEGVVVSIDGQFVSSDTETGHWWFASWLLDSVTPDPSTDEFVRLWYRAVAATLQYDYRLGSGAHHLKRAKKVLPRDPILLFYEGALHEALASPRFQNVPATAPGANARSIALPPEDEQLHEAERLLREAIRHGAPPEATVRLGRVLGARGKHRDAVALLEQAPVPGDARLAYIRDLFLGTEHAALGQAEPARASLERAAASFPTAQSPLLAMSALHRWTGDRQAALDTFRRLEALPTDPAKRVDPWWDYDRSYAADADAQITAVRAWVDRRGTR